MVMSLFIGLDIGTTSIKAAAYDAELGLVTYVAVRQTPVMHPLPGFSEHDPEALWQTVAECLREVTAATGRAPSGLAIASFAEAGVPLDAAGRTLYPFIAWYDRRCEAQAAWWETQLAANDLHAITGQRVTPSFGVNKWLWIRDNLPEVAGRMARWLSAPDYILWRLTGEQVTDCSIASRTLLFDQSTLNWSPEMLQRAQMDRAQLPRVQPSGTIAGAVTSAAAQATGLPLGMPCVLGGHDHLCAGLAGGGYAPGIVIDSTGTAEATLVIMPAFHTGAQAAQAGYACYAHVVAGQYVFKAGLKAAGGAIEWLARQLAGSGVQPEALPYGALSAAAEAGIATRAGPVWLPHLIGSGTPEGDRHSLAALVGVRIEHQAGDLFRGMLESLACWLRHNLESMAELTGQHPEQVVLLGGTLRLHLLAQLKADVTGLPTIVPELPEASATGAAMLAGLGTGYFDSPAAAVASLHYDHTMYEPDPARTTWYDRLYRDVYRRLYGTLAEVNHTLESITMREVS
jgi:xylulokinase